MTSALVSFVLSALASAPGGAGLPPAPCFAPATPPEVVARVTRSALRRPGASSLLPGPVPKYELTSTWSSQGTPRTLTWSVVPDGTPIYPQYAGESSQASSLRSFLDGVYGSRAAWLPVIAQVFERWQELSGITYVYEPNDDGAALATAGGSPGVRGDVRIGGHPIDGDLGVLGYNFFPSNGDMVLDVPDSYFQSTAGGSLRLRNTLAHEHGHGLGLQHTCPVAQTKLMEPFITTRFDGPQHDDVLAVNRAYGDRDEGNDAPGSATPLGALDQTQLTRSDLSIDDDSDTDYYRFSLGAPASTDLTLTPVGWSYSTGPQGVPSQANPSGCTGSSSFDSKTIHDLALTLLDGTGSKVIATFDEQGAGAAESASGVVLPAGTYLLRVSGDASNDVQLYDLDVAASGFVTQIFSDGFESGNPSAWN